MTNLFSMWQDIYSEKRVPAAPVFWPENSLSDGRSSRMKVIEIGELLRWEREKELGGRLCCYT